MTPLCVDSLELRAIENVLDMGGGYVLDFTDRTFADFFLDYRVDIDHAQYGADGDSKAKRLRGFLRLSGKPLAGRVLAGLLRHRLAWKPEGIRPQDMRTYRDAVLRLGGEMPPGAPVPLAEVGEDQLLHKVFEPAIFGLLPIDSQLASALVGRMDEAKKCIGATAYLSAVILCGSVLEGMCLGFGCKHPERANRGYSAQFNKKPPPFQDWKLCEWIDVLFRTGDLSPNAHKFGHGLREFRNYVHPQEQLANRFSPNEHSARIAFQVVFASAEDLVHACKRIEAGA